jgi:hypothetical protein
MRLLLVIFLFAFTTFAFSETYVQVNGISIHDRPGFNSINYGAGLETNISADWTIAGGWYRNSDYQGSAYAYGRYIVYKSGPWDVGIGVGGVTGYTGHPVAPALFPQVCYTWVCGLVIPKVTDTGANAVAFQLRIPVN